MVTVVVDDAFQYPSISKTEFDVSQKKWNPTKRINKKIRKNTPFFFNVSHVEQKNKFWYMQLKSVLWMLGLLYIVHIYFIHIKTASLDRNAAQSLILCLNKTKNWVSS